MFLHLPKQSNVLLLKNFNNFYVYIHYSNIFLMLKINKNLITINSTLKTILLYNFFLKNECILKKLNNMIFS